MKTFFFDEASSLLFGPVAGGGWEGKGKADIVQERLGLSLRGGNRGAFAGYYERGPRLLSKGNRRKIEPKEASSCLIARLFFVFIRQLKILVTTLKFVIHEFLSMETAVLNYATKVICEKK